MPQLDEAKLDFAYRYPFTKEAKELVEHANVTAIDERLLAAGKTRVQNAIDKGDIQFSKTSNAELRYTYLMSYVYARMLVSALNNLTALETYVSAEAKRSAEAFAADEDANAFRVLKAVFPEVHKTDSGYRMPFTSLVKVSGRSRLFPLALQDLENGLVYLEQADMRRLVEIAVRMELRRGLPISQRQLPKEVIAVAKTIKAPEVKITEETGAHSGRYTWIERLLATPIADVRHRSVNLILAPYFVNVKKMDEEKAVQAIMAYMERCRQINPDTRINETYIRYQCRYSKSKGTKPLSLERAKDLLKSMVDLEIVS